MSKHKAKEEEPNFQIRPPFSKKFKPGAVKVSDRYFDIKILQYTRLISFILSNTLTIKCYYFILMNLVAQEIIHGCLNEQLGGKVYDASKVSQWSKAIADNVKSQVKTLGYDRYKIVVEVVIGEQRGEGVRMGSRCLWDSDTDNYASDVYMNDSLFCCTAVFGLYYY